MADRKDFYNRQRVTQAELDASNAALESAERNMRIDNAIYGVISGLVPSLSGASSVAVTSGIALDQFGKRVKAYYDGSGSKTQSYATDTLGAATSVTGGNERWISIIARAGRNALDSRVDGLGVTVYHDQPECLHDGTSSAPPNVAGLGGTGVDKFEILAGTEAATGTATRPTLPTDAILVCDILRTPSDASNTLSTTRRMVFSMIDTAAVGTGINAGSGLKMLMTDFSAWLGGRTNLAQTSLHAQIDKIFTDLAATTASDDGAERIGAATAGNLAAGSVRSQLTELDTEKAGVDLANTFSLVNTFSTRMRMTPTTATPAFDTPVQGASSRMLLCEFEFAAATNTKLRVYLNNTPLFTNGPRNSLLITHNARWDGSAWQRDASNGGEVSVAYAVEIGGNRTTDTAGGSPAYSGGPVVYRGYADNTSDAATWTLKSDLGATRSYPATFTSSTALSGTTTFDLFTGDFVVGVTGASAANARFFYGMSGQATGSFTNYEVVRFPWRFSGVPSSVSFGDTVGATNLGARSSSSTQPQYITVQATVTAAGTYNFVGYIDVRL